MKSNYNNFPSKNKMKPPNYPKNYETHISIKESANALPIWIFCFFTESSVSSSLRPKHRSPILWIHFPQSYLIMYIIYSFTFEQCFPNRNLPFLSPFHLLQLSINWIELDRSYGTPPLNIIFPIPLVQYIWIWLWCKITPREKSHHKFVWHYLW